jgi:Lar family restriction alleviation protein
MSEQLKPCPCCGGKPYEIEREHTLNGLHGIICGGCDLRVFSTKDKAIAIWNRRQEAKPLTEIELRDIIESEELKREADLEYYSMILPSVQFADAIYAALPPDQSARIAEMESQRDRLIWEIKNVIDMHKRRAAGFSLGHEIEMATKEHAENLIREIEGGQ